MKKNQKITTCKWLDLETLGSWPIMPKNLSGLWSKHIYPLGLGDIREGVTLQRITLPYSINFLLKLLYLSGVWSSVWFGVAPIMDIKKTCVYKRLCQVFNCNSHSRFNNQRNWGDMYDHIINMRILTLTMNKVSIQDMSSIESHLWQPMCMWYYGVM